jgi:predicted MFS family arabinose efflux permease
LKTFTALLRDRPHFRRLWLSEVISLLGDWMSFVAVSLLALQKGGSVVALALVLVGHSLPHALFAPIAGALADRLDRKRLMIATNVAQAALTAAMAVAAARGSVAWVQALVFLRASVGAFLPPVQSAALRHTVNSDELLAANTISSLTWSVMFALGMAAGGLIAALGPALALALDAASFLGAALLLVGLPSMTAEGRPEGGVLAALASIQKDTISAVRYAVHRPSLLEAVLAKTPLAIAGGGAWVLLNLTANDTALIGSGAVALGVLQCVRGVGTGVGPVLSSALIRRGASIERAFSLSAWVLFGSVAVFALGSGWAILLVATLTWGAGTGSNWVLSSAQIQRLSPDRFVGRLSAIDGLLYTTGMCAAALVGSLLVQRTAWNASSAWLGVAAGAATFLGLRWAIRRMRTRTHGEQAITLALDAPRP